MSGMEPQPMKGLQLAESGRSSTEFTNSGDGPSYLKRKRSSSESAIWGIKRRRTASREQPPTPNGSSQVKSLEIKKFPYETKVESSGETGYTHANLKRKRSTSEPPVSSIKRRKVAHSHPLFRCDSPSPLRSSSERNMTNSNHPVRDSSQVQGIGWTESSRITSFKNHTRKSDNRPLASSEVNRCLLTQELSSEAAVEPCYLLNQRLWNSELLTRLECWWGMEYNSLNPGTESNKIYLRRDWLKSFDSERWLLLPTPEMIEKVSDRCDKFVDGLTAYSDQPPIDTIYDGAETFQYRMLPLDAELRSFIRINWHDSPSGSKLSEIRTAANQRRTRHSHPFHTLPTLVSRAKPHFVICDAAAKLHQRHIVGPDFAALLESVWQGHDFDTYSLTFSIRNAYDIWFTHEVPAKLVSTPRILVPIPPLHPYLIVARRHCPTGRSCCGPCVHNRFAWLPTYCANCGGVTIDSAGDPNSAHLNGNFDAGDSSDRMAQYHTYLRRLARRINDWQSCCMQQVKKRGRWTSCVVNDKQLGGYSIKPRRTLSRIV